MKTLTKYIIESTESFRVTDVEVTYNVDPVDFIIQAPETFQESDVQQYLDDRYLENLPTGKDYSEKFFGKNKNEIYDAHFEYESFEHLSVEPKDYIEWDSKFNTSSSNNDDIKLDYFKVNNLKYIISFDKFDLVDVDEDEVEDHLIKIFKAAESNDDNEYDLTIQFDEDSLKFRK